MRFLSISVVLAGFVSTAHAEIGTTVTPEAGNAPLRIGVGISVNTFTVRGVSLTYGDGDTRVWYDNGEALAPFSFSESHEYTCPGIYTLRVEEFDGNEWLPRTWQINVSQPGTFSIVPTVQGGLVHLVTTSDESVEAVDMAVVDWGDGTPLEEFRWRKETVVYFSPPHNYAVAGQYDVIVTNQFIGPHCGLSVATSLVVVIESTTPVSSTTWGRIKALYR